MGPKSYRSSTRSSSSRAPRSGTIKWTTTQDAQLQHLVTIHGCGRWARIASVLDGRSSKQCRERWINHADPSITRSKWTREEDRQLIELHERFGNAWARISKELPGRAQNNVKNHWHGATIRKYIAAQSTDFSSSSSSDYDGQIGPWPAVVKVEASSDTETSCLVVNSRPNSDLERPDNIVTSDFSDATSSSSSLSPIVDIGEDNFLLEEKELKAFLDGIDLKELMDAEG